MRKLLKEGPMCSDTALGTTTDDVRLAATHEVSVQNENSMLVCALPAECAFIAAV